MITTTMPRLLGWKFDFQILDNIFSKFFLNCPGKKATTRAHTSGLLYFSTPTEITKFASKGSEVLHAFGESFSDTSNASCHNKIVVF